METIIKRLSKGLGYTLSHSDVISMYRDGTIIITDQEEDSIIKYIETNGIA